MPSCVTEPPVFWFAKRAARAEPKYRLHQAELVADRRRIASRVSTSESLPSHLMRRGSRGSDVVAAGFEVMSVRGASGGTRATGACAAVGGKIGQPARLSWRASLSGAIVAHSLRRDQRPPLPKTLQGNHVLELQSRLKKPL